jgi:hypothetical protein
MMMAFLELCQFGAGFRVLRGRAGEIRIVTDPIAIGVFVGMGFGGTHILKDLLRDG